MGNTFACGSPVSVRYEDTLWERVWDVDDTLSEFAESLNTTMEMLSKVLDRSTVGMQDRTDSEQPLRHRCLEKLNQKQRKAMKNVYNLLQAITSVLVKHNSSIDISERHLKLEKHLAETFSKGRVLNEFANSEFGKFDTFVKDLQDENKRLRETIETRTERENASDKQSKEVEMKNSKMQTEGSVKERKDVRKGVSKNDTETLESTDHNDHLLSSIRPNRSQSFKSLENENEKLKQKFENMQKQLNDQEAEFVIQKENFEQNLEHLRKENEEAFQHFEKKTKMLHQQHEDKQNELTVQNDILSKLKYTLECRIANEIDKNAKIQSQIKCLFKFIQEYEAGGSLLKEDVEDVEILLDNLERSLRRLVEENGSFKVSNRDLSTAQASEKETMEKQIRDMKEQNDELDAKTKELLEENLSLQTTFKLQNETNAALLTEATNELDKQRKTNNEMEEALMSAKQDNQKLQADYESIKDELNKVKSAKVMRVQLYHPNRIPLVSDIENELTVLLKSEMEDGLTELEFIECKEACDIDLNIPLLIVCVTASRIGTDAANIIQALKVTSKMALIMVHHKDEHALPNQESERVLTGKAFVRLGGIYDLAFLTRKGVYSCEMNLKNIKTLVYFLNKEGVRSMREDQ